MSLSEEIIVKRNQIFRESYQMSIGELINLYKDGEMNIHPEFQRLFRWSEVQKTRLIESIMLNIPIPPVFVSQDKNGAWDIIDGVQRLSTIFQFVGILNDDANKLVEALVLLKTDFIPSFAGVKWENDNEPDLSFNKEQQLYFKRSRIDVNIVKYESDANTKYELFQRLNTGGTLLSDQEVRNCLMIMSNKELFEIINRLSKKSSFINLTPISDNKADEQYRMELILRLIISFYIDWNLVKGSDDFGEILDRETLKLCKRTDINFQQLEIKLGNTFDFIYFVMGENSFKRFDNNNHIGPVLYSAFQCISYGIFNNFDDIQIKNKPDIIKERIHQLYSQDSFINYTKKGTRAPSMYKGLTKFGDDYFKL